MGRVRVGLTAFGLMLAGTCPAQDCLEPVSGDVVINEILYDFSASSLEFVELYNRSGCTFDLSLFSLSDSRGVKEPIATSPSPLPPEAFAVLVSDALLFESAFPGLPYVVPPRWPALNNGGDAVVVGFAGVTLDSVQYGGAWASDGNSIERRSPVAPSSLAGSWSASIDPLGATPGRVNSVFSADSLAPMVVYAEEESPDVIHIKVSEPVSSLEAAQFSVNDSRPSSVEPAATSTEYRLVFERPIDGNVLTYDALQDLSGNVASPGTLPIARLARPGDLILSEIMFDPRSLATDGLPDQPEYLEIYNRSTNLISVRGIRVGEAADELGERRSTLITDDRLAVEPSSFLVLHDADDVLELGSARPAAFAGFGADVGDSAVWISTSAITPSGLANGGQTVGLLAADGSIVDELIFGPHMHSLTLREFGETRGTSLERRTTGVGSDAILAWTSSVAPAGGTPGKANSVWHNPTPHPRDGSGSLVLEPSPFSPNDDGYEDVVHVRYRLRSSTSMVRLRVFDLSGRPVRTLEHAGFSGAEGALIWDGYGDGGRPLPTGAYVLLLESMSAESADLERLKALVTLVRR